MELNKLILIIGLFAALILVSCNKENVEPAPQQPSSNTGNNNNSNQDTLPITFVVTTDVASSELDSVIIKQYQYSTYTELSSVTIYPNQITLGNYIQFSALSIMNVPNDFELTGDDSFSIKLYLNTSTSYSADINNRFEFGYNSPYSTASNPLEFLYEGGLGVLGGYQVY